MSIVKNDARGVDVVGLDVVDQALAAGGSGLDDSNGDIAEPDGFLPDAIGLVVFADQVTRRFEDEAMRGVDERRVAFDEALAEAVVEVAGADGAFASAFAGGILMWRPAASQLKVVVP